MLDSQHLFRCRNETGKSRLSHFLPEQVACRSRILRMDQHEAAQSKQVVTASLVSRVASNTIGGVGLAIIAIVWTVNFWSRLEIALPEQYWNIYRHVLPFGSVCFTLAASIKGKKVFWIPASVFCAIAAWLFLGSRDL